MQGLEISSSNSEKPFEVRILSQIEHHLKRVESLAGESPCPELKVAYILVDRDMRELAHGVNGYREDGSPCAMTENGHEDVHAEDRLSRDVWRLAIDTDGACAIGNFSPCRDCVRKLAAVGIRQIIFNNMYRDTFALSEATRLGMRLWYFHDSQVYNIPHEVIERLESLIGSLISVLKNNNGNPLSSRLGRPQTQKAYIAIHEEELRILLDLLLQELLAEYFLGLDGDDSARQRVEKLVCQIETECMCLHLARVNIILTKHP